MTNNVKKTYSSPPVKKFIDLLKVADYTKIEELLDQYCHSLYWCYCGSTYLKEDDLPHLKAGEEHSWGCHEHYESPSATIFLEIAIEKKDIELLKMIKRRSLQKRPYRWRLTPRQWVMVLEEVCASNHVDVVRLFDWRWLLGLHTRAHAIKEFDVGRYATYVWKVFEAMKLNDRTKSPDLNRLMLSEFVGILLPPYSETVAYELLMEGLNKLPFGELFLDDRRLSHVREKMVREHGILWRPHDSSSVRNSAQFRSVIRFVLDTYAACFTKEHCRWFQSLRGVYLLYLEQYAAKTLEHIQSSDDPWLDKQRALWSLGRYVPVESTKRTLWRTCFDAVPSCPCVAKRKKYERLGEILIDNNDDAGSGEEEGYTF